MAQSDLTLALIPKSYCKRVRHLLDCSRGSGGQKTQGFLAKALVTRRSKRRAWRDLCGGVICGHSCKQILFAGGAMY